MIYLFVVGLMTGFIYTFCAFSSILTAMQFSLRNGCVSGFIAGLGHTAAQIIWAGIAIAIVALGTNVIKTEIDHYKFFAAFLLFVLAIKFFISPPSVPDKISRHKSASFLEAFATVFIVAISAPGRIIGYFALYMLMGAALIVSADFIEKQLLLAGTVAGIIIWWIIFSVIFSRLKLTPTKLQIAFLQRATAFLLIMIAISLCLFPYKFL